MYISSTGFTAANFARQWQCYFLSSCFVVLAFFYTQSAQAQNWSNSYFRGTPNNWAATPLIKNTSNGLWETQQAFSGTNPRFKISRYTDNWNEAYPAQDYLITGGDGDYKITFNDTTKAVIATKLPVAIPANNICFSNPNNFATPYIYFWNPLPAGAVTPLPAWPGKSMTKRGTFYCYDFTTSIPAGIQMPTSLDVIFSNNGANQTANLKFTGAACYDNNVWKALSQCGFSIATNSSVATSSSALSVSSVSLSSSSSLAPSSSSLPSPAVSSSKSSSSVSSSSSINVVSSSQASIAVSASSSSVAVAKTKIYFKNTANWASVNIHYFNVLPALTASTWPGVAMVKNTSTPTFFSYEFAATVNSAGIVFNTNSNPKTADLNFIAPNNCYDFGTASWKTASACGVPVDVIANAGVDRKANVNTRQSFSAAGSVGDFVSAAWSSPAWPGVLTGKQVVTPLLTATGTFIVTLTLTTADNRTVTDTMVMTLGAAMQGLPERPQLAAPLGFPITGNVSTGKYRFVNAFPGLDDFFYSPVMVTNDGINDLVYVVDKEGAIYVFPNKENVTKTEIRKLLDIKNTVLNNNESGMLSMAFDPDYASNGFIYVYYIYGETDEFYPRTDGITFGGKTGDAILERWTVNNPANPTAASGKVEVLRIPQIGEDHKGGMMQFHPVDGYLYVGIGEGGYGNTALPQNPLLAGANGRHNNSAQNPATLLGKFIRIDPIAQPVDGKYYQVPADNPFVGTAGYRPEIWSMGHRNPWRWAFDTVAPYTLWETEIGQDTDAAYEEVNIITKGLNYGWPVCEGTRNRANLGGSPAKNCLTDFIPPREGYGRTSGFSIIGGFVYRGADLPNLNGSFIFGDYVTKRLWSVADNGQPKKLISEAFPHNISSIGKDLNQNVLISSHGRQYGGPSSIFKIVDDDLVSVQIPVKLSATGLFADLAGLVPAHGVIEYGVNTQGWFDGAAIRRFISVPNTEKVGFAERDVWNLPVGSVVVKHLSVMMVGNVTKPFTTSVLFRQVSGWQAANYRWNAAGTDADLVTESTVVADNSITNVQRKVETGSTCSGCHKDGEGKLSPLAIHTRQLNGDFIYQQGLSKNQLDVFNHIGLFTAAINNASSYEQFTAPTDPNASLTLRTKSYLHTNCAHCHATTTGMNMRYDATLEQMHLVNVNGRVIPGEPENSRVYSFQLGQGMRMPSGSVTTNPVAAALFEAWIKELGAEAVQSGVSLNANKTVLAVNDSVTLTVKALFNNGTTGAIDGPVLWLSSNPAVASVGSNTTASINLTLGAAGSTTISVQSGSFSAELQLTVGEDPHQVTTLDIVPKPADQPFFLNSNNQQLVVFGKTAAGTTVNLFGKGVTWRIASGGSFAAINNTGLLTRIAGGAAVAEATYGNLKTTINIIVLPPGLAVRYNNPKKWPEVCIHYYNDGHNTTNWPGVKLVDSDGDNWWSHVIETKDLVNGKVNVIFNNCAKGQQDAAQNIAAHSSVNGATVTPWDVNDSGKLTRLSVIGGSTPNNQRDYSAGQLVIVTADTPPFGTNFKGWTGDGLAYVVGNPNSVSVQVVIPALTNGLSLQALFASDDPHSAARILYGAQCAGCHGAKGEGGLGGTLNNLHQNGSRNLAQLAQYIHDEMPKGDPTRCVGTTPNTCAYDIAAMILDNAWSAPGDTCTGPECNGSAVDSRNMRLLTKEEYLNSLRDILAIPLPDTLMTSVPSDGGTRNFATSAVLRINEDRADGYKMVAEQIADLVITTKGFNGLVSGCSNNLCVVQQLGRKLFRRPLTTVEANKYLALYSANDTGRTLVQALLLSPNFMYRSELGTLDSATGLYRLTDYEIATLLAYTLWVTTPDETLLSAAAAGNLNIDAQVRRMLSDPRAEKGLRRFASGWFIYNQYAFAAVDRTLASAFVEETVRFVVESIKENVPFNTLLTANYTYVNSQLASYYGMAPVSDWTKAYYAPGDKRAGAGVLAHGSMLVSRAGTKNPSPIKRGVFVRSVIMCQDFPAPAAADFNVKFEPTDSNRDATARHTNDPACASCHQFIDGVGFGFEGFGSNGLFRTTEVLGNGQVKDINAAGSIKSLFSPETFMDPNSESHDYFSVPELAGLIANSGQGAACYSRQFYRYAIGRNENSQSDERIIRAYSAELRSGGGMKDMLIKLMLSDSFITRR